MAAIATVADVTATAVAVVAPVAAATAEDPVAVRPRMNTSPEASYRLAFFHSRWPTLLVAPQTRQVLDLNLAWRDFAFFEGQLPADLDQWLQGEWPPPGPAAGTVTPFTARVRQGPDWRTRTCHAQWLAEDCLSISFEPVPGADTPEARINQNRRKSELIANVSHEMRTPLTAILGWPEILLDAQGMPSLAREAAEAIRKDGVYLNRLLEDLIDISKIEAGYLRLNLQRENLQELIANALETVQDKARQKNIQIHWQPPHQTLWVHADNLRMTQILWNYLSNAIKYTPRGGKITVQAEAAAEQVIVSISDTGIGMQPAFQTQAFERFSRAEEVSHLEGAGIGLSLVKKLVHLHQGQCWAESEPGTGSCFYFSVPRSPAPASSPTSRADKNKR
ncbi:MAG: HAMP domain-containing histidine kinase [Candidatus Sericytochromatia bacterium]|nr:HAMP domain-containing histidine kinase [Candidatus Sericytochromatia bacterium]